MTRRRLAILSIREQTTTARYFEKAARAAGHAVSPMSEIGSAKRLQGFDAVLVFDPWMGELEALRDAPCPTLVYLIDVHRHLGTRLAFARYVDHVFVAQSDFVPMFEALPHPSVHWLPLGCDPDVHFVPRLERAFDVGFVGKFGEPGTARHTTLKAVLSAFATNDTSRFYSPEEMGRTYSASKIVFNRSIGNDLNMRFFEGLASGALLVTDRIGNGLAEIGSDRETYILYDTAEEAGPLIQCYLKNDQGRMAIAARGQTLAFEAHTYAHRLATMLGTLDSHSADAPARTAPFAIERRWRSEWLRMKGVSPLEAARFAAGGLDWHATANAAVGLARYISQQTKVRLRK